MQARSVSPEVLGMYSGIGLVMAYAPVLHLGVLDGLSRELPRLSGQGSLTHVNSLAAAAQAWALWIGSLSAGVLIGVSAWHIACGKTDIAWAWASHSIIIGVFFLGAYIQILYRTWNDFVRLAWVGVATNAIGLILVSVVAVWGYYGLCIRGVLVSIITVALLNVYSRKRIKPQWQWAYAKHLLQIGAPILVAGYVLSLWSVLNSTLVLHYLGNTGIGLYSIVLIFSAIVEIIPQTVEQVLYPKILKRFGQTRSLTSLAAEWRRPMTAALLSSILSAAAIWFGADILVKTLFPDYGAAVDAIKWAAVVPVLGCISPVTTLFSVLQKQGYQVGVTICGIISYVVAVKVLTRNGAALEHFSQALLFGRAIYIAGSILAIKILAKRTVTGCLKQCLADPLK